MSNFVKQLETLLETMSNELPAGEIHRLILYPDSSGLVESEGFEQFEFFSIDELMGNYQFQCRRCGDMVGWEELFDFNNVCADCRGVRLGLGYRPIVLPSTRIVAQMVVRISIDLMFAIMRDLRRHGGLRWRFAISFIVAFILIVAILNIAPHIIGVLGG